MAGSASGSAGNIAVTAHRAQGGAKVDATKAYIINQRGSKKFKISLADLRLTTFMDCSAFDTRKPPREEPLIFAAVSVC